ncbi:MAG: tetratricopeptide repeat protein [Treponema sp.]|jgi:tetratricopeptide (TPR) repeat protein|nr:tetratricopeptide repeat protein [Treponema sp.]
MRFYALLPFLLTWFTLPAFSQEAQANPLTAIQRYQIGRNLEAAGRIDEANVRYDETIRVCQEEVSRNAANSDTYAAITWALIRQRKYQEAAAWGDRGLALYANDYRIVEAMGEAYFYLDDYNRSLASMQRYVNALPRGERSSVAYFFIGEIYRLSGKYRHADIAYTTAVQLEPNLALWWYRLASVRESAGDYRPAVEAYQQALRINPDYTEAGAGLARARTRVSETP